MHEKHSLQASVSIRCRRCSCRLDKTLTSSFSRTSPTTTPLLGLHPAVLYLSPRSLLPTLHYPHVINVVHLTNLSIRHITSATPTKLSSHCSPYRSLRAFRRVPGPSILLGTPKIEGRRKQRLAAEVIYPHPIAVRDLGVVRRCPLCPKPVRM